MRYLVGFGRFWYEFIIGDDWRIAAGVTVVLAVGAVVEAAGLGGDWLPPALALGMAAVFAAPLLAGSRPRAIDGGSVATVNRPARADQDGAL